jgi:hypothetical protein
MTRLERAWLPMIFFGSPNIGRVKTRRLVASGRLIIAHCAQFPLSTRARARARENWPRNVHAVSRPMKILGVDIFLLPHARRPVWMKPREKMARVQSFNLLELSRPQISQRSRILYCLSGPVWFPVRFSPALI